MSRFVLIGAIDIATGKRAQVLPAVIAHSKRCRRDEPGTLQFDVLVPADQPDKLMVCEVYSDAGAFEAHNKGASMAQMQAQAGALVTGFTPVAATLAT